MADGCVALSAQRTICRNNDAVQNTCGCVYSSHIHLHPTPPPANLGLLVLVDKLSNGMGDLIYIEQSLDLDL